MINISIVSRKDGLLLESEKQEYMLPSLAIIMAFELRKRFPMEDYQVLLRGTGRISQFDRKHLLEASTAAGYVFDEDTQPAREK